MTDKSYKDYPVPDDFKSDGCTYAPDLNFRECCRQHDYLRRFDIVTTREADKMLRQCIRAKSNGFIAWVYFLAVRTAIFLGFYE